MDYGEVIKESFQIFWKNKILWLFGIMAAFFGHNDYKLSMNFNGSFSSPSMDGNPPEIPPFVKTLANNISANPMLYIATIILITLVWWVIKNIFGWLAQGALIGMVDEIDKKQSTSLGQGWRIGLERITPLFIIALLLTLPMLLIIIPAVIWGISIFIQFLTMMSSTETDPNMVLNNIMSMVLSGVVCLVPLACIGGILSTILRLLNIISARSCVLEKLGVVGSLKRGWQVAINNIGYILLNWFLLGIVKTVSRIIIAIPAFMIMMAMMAALINKGLSSILFISTFLAFITYFIIFMFGLGGILTSFNSTLWTKLYKAFLDEDETLVVLEKGVV